MFHYLRTVEKTKNCTLKTPTPRYKKWYRQNESCLVPCYCNIARNYLSNLLFSKQNLGEILFKRSSCRNRRTSASSTSTFHFHPKSCLDTVLARYSVYSLELFPGGFEWIIAKANASFDIFKYEIWFSLPPLISIALEKQKTKRLLHYDSIKEMMHNIFLALKTVQQWDQFFYF